MTTGAALRATRPLRIGLRTSKARVALRALRAELHGPAPSPEEADDVLAAIEACLAALDRYAAIPPDIDRPRRPGGPIRLTGAGP